MEDINFVKGVGGCLTPTVRFGLNGNFVAQCLSRILKKGVGRGGADFGKIAEEFCPEFIGYGELEPEERLRKVSEYVQAFYQQHDSQLKEAVLKDSAAWGEYAPQFFSEVKKIFKKTDWPDGRYIGYLSIAPPYPRFLETKIFLVTWQSVKGAIKTTAHEMLHFIFFEYVRQRYLPDCENIDGKEVEQKLKGKFKVPIWDLSEIFNLMILSGKEWGIASIDLSKNTYQSLVGQVPEFRRIWDETGHDIDEFFTRLETKPL